MSKSTKDTIEPKRRNMSFRNPKTFLLVLALILISLISFSYNTMAVKALSGQQVSDKITNALDIQVKIPHPKFVQVTSGSEYVSLWLIVAVFAMLFSVIYVLSMRLAIFKGDSGFLKGPATVFAAAITLIVIFSSAFVEWVASLAGALARLAAVAMLILAILLMWYYSSAAYHTGKKMAMEAAKGSASAKKGLAAAQKDEQHAVHELEMSKKKLQKEHHDLEKARHKMHDLHIDTKNEISSLEQIADVIKHLASASTEEAKQLKKQYQRQLAALSSLIQHESKSLVEYRNRIHRIHSLGHRVLREEGDETAITNRILQEVIGRHGAVPAGAAGHAQRVARARAAGLLAREAFRLNKEHERIAKEIEHEMQLVASEDQKANEQIHRVMSSLHNDEYPAALSHINEAMRLKHHVDTQFRRAEHFDTMLHNLEHKQLQLDNKLEHLLVHLRLP